VATIEEAGLRARPRPQITAGVVAAEPRGWTSWITTTDHKRIGILYLWTCAVFFILGGVEALLIRIQLGVPENTFLDPEKYNQVMTMHGTTMIFLVVVPIWAGFGNYVIPLMIGARDMAFPAPERVVVLDVPVRRPGAVRVDVLHAAGGRLVLLRPAVAEAVLARDGQEAWIYMVHLTGLSSILGAINFIATIHNMRAPGMGWGRMPLFVWTILIYAYLIILALTSLAATVTMLLLDRNFGRRSSTRRGRLGAAVAAPVLVLRAPRGLHPRAARVRGVLEILPVFARKPIFGYKAIAASTAGIAFLGMLVWAHHMFARRCRRSCWRSSCSRAS
jgi:cytochrome c oxidase subunit 1